MSSKPRTSKKTNEIMLMLKYGTPKFGTTAKDHNAYIKSILPKDNSSSSEEEDDDITNKIDTEKHDTEEEIDPMEKTSSLNKALVFPGTCPGCNHFFETAQAYATHEHTCAIYRQASSHHGNERHKAEQETTLPLYYELVRQVQHLQRTVTHQQETIQYLSRWVASQKRKVSITEWLEEHASPSILFKDWMDSIRVTPEDVQYLYDNDYFETMANTIRRFLPTECRDELAIRAFDQRKGYMYVYDTGTHLRALKIRIKPVEDEEDDKKVRWYCLPIKTLKCILEHVVQLYYREISAWVKERCKDPTNNTVRMMQMTKKMATASGDPTMRITRVMNKVFIHLREHRQLITRVTT